METLTKKIINGITFQHNPNHNLSTSDSYIRVINTNDPTELDIYDWVVKNCSLDYVTGKGPDSNWNTLFNYNGEKLYLHGPRPISPTQSVIEIIKVH